MKFGYFTLFVAFVISAVAEYYSIIGLTSIFAAAFWSVVIMGGALGVGKLTATLWLKINWDRAPIAYKLYLIPAVTILMFLTSVGCFGYLSKAHSDQSLVSGDGQAKVAIYDEKISTAKDNIAMARKALKQMDDAVDQVMGRSDDEKGADKAVAIRRGQSKERARLLGEIEVEQKKVAQLSEERAPYAAEFRRIENEVGPIKYIAALLYGDNPDANILEKAVRWVIILIVAVLDPLALVLVLAGQQSIRWAEEDKERKDIDDFVTQAAKDVLDEVESQEEHSSVENTKDTQAEKSEGEPEKSIFERHPYLLNPFAHFKNMVPMVSKSEKTIMDDVAESIESPKDLIPEEAQRRLEDGEHLSITELPELQAFIKKGLEDGTLDIQGTTAPQDDQVHLEKEFLERFDENLKRNTPEILTMGIDVVDRPGDYVKEPKWTGPMKEITEEIIDPNTRIRTLNHRWVPDLDAVADNEPVGHKANADFGTSFPEDPQKGDMYVRVDFLPPRLFKFNGVKWMEVDKSMTDSYYSEEYIKHLIDKINNGEYSVDELSDSEQDQIREYLTKK